MAPGRGCRRTRQMRERRCEPFAEGEVLGGARNWRWGGVARAALAPKASSDVALRPCPATAWKSSGSLATCRKGGAARAEPPPLPRRQQPGPYLSAELSSGLTATRTPCAAPLVAPCSFRVGPGVEGLSGAGAAWSAQRDSQVGPLSARELRPRLSSKPDGTQTDHKPSPWSLSRVLGVPEPRQATRPGGKPRGAAAA